MKKVNLVFIGLLFIFATSCKKIETQETPKALMVSTLAGNGALGFVDGIGENSVLANPAGSTVDASGNLYIADYQNHRIRKITSTGVVSTIAGTGESGFADGPGNSAKFSYPNGITIDAAGNIYISDSGNSLIRKITPGGIVSTLAGTLNSSGYVDGSGTSAKFSSILQDLAIDPSGNIIVADRDNQRIRKITPAGIVSTVAGTGIKSTINGPVATATFDTPTGITVDPSGNIYVSQGASSLGVIRRITPTGTVSTFAGTSGAGYFDGIGATAKFRTPYGLSSDAAGNIYVADLGNQRIRKISSSGFVSTIAGTGEQGFANGLPSVAKFSAPYDVSVDASGNLYIVENSGNRIRKISEVEVVEEKSQAEIDRENWNRPKNLK